MPDYLRNCEGRGEYQLRSTATPQTAWEGGGEHGHREDQLGQGVGGGDGDKEEYHIVLNK